VKQRVYLVGQIMEHTGRCVTVSEPESTSIVATRYRKLGDSLELRQLARDAIRWECRPYTTMQPPPLGYLLKLAAPCVVLLPTFRQASLSLPLLSRYLFLYLCPSPRRHCEFSDHPFMCRVSTRGVSAISMAFVDEFLRNFCP